MSTNGKNFKDILRDARPAERSVPVCLRADLVAEHETAERALDKAVNEPRTSLAAGSAVSALGEQIRALEAQMAEATIDFRLRAMSRPKWKALIAEHQPRKAEDGSVEQRDLIGVNADTFFEALLRVSVVEPELDADDWTVLLETLSDAQFDALSNVAWALNRRDVDVPFSRAASRLTEPSDDE